MFSISQRKAVAGLGKVTVQEPQEPSSPLEGTWLYHLKGKTNTPLSGREFGQMAYFSVNSYMCLLKAQRKKK